MTKAVHAEVEAAILGLLRGAGHLVDEVRVEGRSSGGAMRDTYFVVAAGSDGPTHAVAQVRPSAVMADQLVLVGDEAAILSRAAKAQIPVAPVLAVGPGPEGLPTLVTGRIPGESIPRRVLRAVAATPDAGDQLTDACARALAMLHGIPVTELPPSLDRLQPPAYVTQLEESLDALAHPYPVLRAGLVWLKDNLPEHPSAPSVVHGDFRNGNLIVDQGHLAAVVDWELAHVGDPMEDLAYLCLRSWRYGHDEYEVGGFGHLDRLRHQYERAGGEWDQGRFDWWTVARTVWWGIGLASQAAAFMAGESKSIVHAASGRRVVELEYDLIRLLEAHVS